MKRLTETFFTKIIGYVIGEFADTATLNPLKSLNELHKWHSFFARRIFPYVHATCVMTCKHVYDVLSFDL
mgnify:CR=1 FL=1